MKKTMLMLALLAAGSVGAEELNLSFMPETVGIHGVSIHANDGKRYTDGRGWNNFNLGVYGRWDSGLTVGTFRNSEYKQSFYAGWTFATDNDMFAVTVGAITGYEKAVMPLVAPSMKLRLDERTSVRLTIIPSPKAPAAHVSLEIRL